MSLWSPAGRRHKRTSRLLLLLMVLAFYIFPPLTIDIALTGRLDEVLLSRDRVPVKAYAARLEDPIEAIIRFLVVFTAFYAIILVVNGIDPPSYGSYRHPECLLGLLLFAYLWWLVLWGVSAHAMALSGPEYAPALWILNIIAASHLSYFAAIFRFFTTPTCTLLGVAVPAWPLAILLIALMFVGYYTGAGAAKLVWWAVKRATVKRLLKGGDRAAEFIKEYAALAEEYSSHSKLWDAKAEALEEAIKELPSGDLMRIREQLCWINAKSMRLDEIKRKVTKEISKFSAEAAAGGSWGPMVKEAVRRPGAGRGAEAAQRKAEGRPPAAQRPRRPQPIQREAAGGRPHAQAGVQGPASPGEAWEKLKAAEEERRARERAALYESIVSLKIFDEVVGLREVKEEIAWRFLIPVLFPEKAPKGVEPKFGVLLYGPPGVGKSVMIRMLKDVCERLGIRTFMLGPDVINKKLVGLGEEEVKNIFAEARKGPSAIFIDEAEAAMGRHQPYEAHYHRGPVAQLLQEIDGVASASAKILIVAATNKPWNIDEAFLRPGRMDMVFYVKPPEREERAEIFKRNLMNVETAGPIDYERLADLTSPSRAAGYYSGADIMGICKRAIVKAARAGRKVTMADLEEAIREAKPTISPYLIADYERFAEVRGGAGAQRVSGQTFYTA